ncbi:MAG: dihydrolipoyl dehydrogenase [Clostridiales bacterium]|jgi:dihydrolipoamide dehydrogenase|nr:dihydrolipoyl dehydrogenase [Clostridiales bacterium]
MIFDLIIIGGGPAGYLGAERAGHAGLNVALIEERSLGGVCLNEGCIPTKTLLYSAKLYDGVAKGSKYGVSAEGLTIDHESVIKRKDKVVRTLVAGVKSQMKANKVTVFDARGVITGKTNEGYTVKAGDEVLTGKKLLITTGSVPAVPPIPGLKEGLDSGFVQTSREILDLKTVPNALCVIGGGVIGLELASYFCSIGTKVTVVEMLDHIAGENDQELVALLKADFEKRGIIFHLESRVTGIEQNGVRFEHQGESKLVEADKVLLSIGRRANTANLGLDSIGVNVERGAIPVDDKMRTNQPGVYAAGDVTGFSMLAHTAYREAEVAVSDILGQHDRMRYDAIPAVLYTNPELASVGETEDSAKRKGLNCAVVKLPMRFSGRYLAENEGGNGIMKLIVDKGSQRVLGLQALSNYASEFIITAGTYIEMGLTLSQIKKIVFPHPTVAEIIREAVFAYTE